MKRIFILTAIFALAFSFNISAQTEEVSKKEQKAAKRALEAQKDSIAGVIAKDAIANGEWIFRAISMNVSGGAMINVPSNLNFLMVQGDQFTFQTSTGFGGGPNNMGGITTTGLIKVENVDVDKHGNISYSLRLNGTILNAVATLNLNRNSNIADLYLNMDRGTRNISMAGAVYTIGSAQVFEGSLK
ncbi:MAG: DUF4251 domain-containing protein [Muribaculaceae bacterium]|nr:DUF4251 domain-containing protein [Muribaculaceae bacterium]